MGQGWMGKATVFFFWNTNELQFSREIWKEDAVNIQISLRKNVNILILSIDIYVSSLLSWTTKTTTNAYSDNTRTRNDNQPIIGSSITPTCSNS